MTPVWSPSLVSFDCAFDSSQLEVKKPPSLLRIGIADHHLLHAALPARRAADEGHREQLAHDGGRRAKIVDGLEQGHDRQRADLGAGGIEEDARLLGEHIDAEHVGDRARHRQDEAAERLAVELPPHLRHEAEHRQRLLGLWRQPFELAVGIARPRELGHDPRLPRLRAWLRHVAAIPARSHPPDFLQGLGGAGGVLAEVEPDGGEAEDLRGEAHRPHQVGGDRGEVRLLQRILQHAKIDDQLVGIGVIGTALRRLVRAFGAGNGGVELPQHAGEILAVGLARIAGADAGRVCRSPQVRARARRGSCQALTRRAR